MKLLNAFFASTQFGLYPQTERGPVQEDKADKGMISAVCCCCSTVQSVGWQGVIYQQNCIPEIRNEVSDHTILAGSGVWIT